MGQIYTVDYSDKSNSPKPSMFSDEFALVSSSVQLWTRGASVVLALG